MCKKLIISLLTLFLSITAYSQITIDANDMPDVGDTIRRSVTFDITGYDFEETGNDYTWNFSNLLPVEQQVDTFVSVGSTPFVYQLVFIYPFVATIASPTGNGLEMFPDSVISDVYSFFKETDEKFQLAGYAATLSGIPLPAKYDEPDVWYNFPMEPGDMDSSLSSFEMNVPEIGFFSTERKRVNTVDGWGTLTTPFGTFETLRVKSEVNQYDSLYIDSLNMGFPIEREYTEYKWLGNDFGLPLIKATEESLGGYTIQYIDSVRTITSMPETASKPNQAARIYPNPTGASFTIHIKSNNAHTAYIDIRDLNGRLVHVLYAGKLSQSGFQQNYRIKNLGLKPGVYVINFKLDESSFNKKLIVR
ncbi:MAG: T9SS type A sorting domain-containing protein [Bacteroidales bacterium]|nr:T9SS type A sorting domain-containing protein [Bacteroidales bacterium]